MKAKTLVIIAGVVVGVFALLLTAFGNPANMGFCIACFIRDTAGGLKLHSAGVVQYVRPEIIGLVLGAFIVSLVSKEFSPRAGSAPGSRFVLGFFMMIGALMFLGCPLRMMLRIAGGDLNAIVGLVGFVAGILIGIAFLNKGFSLKRAYKISKADGYIFPAIQVVLLVLLLGLPALLAFSAEGPGSMHAPIALALIAGLVVGGVAQKSRLCTAGGIRDAILLKDFTLLIGFVTIIAVVLIGNIALNNFNLGFEGQPIAHNDGLWNFLGMALVGWAAVLLGGCPLRQLILSGEGNVDSAITAVGMLIGAAFAHNFGLASSGQGPTLNGQIAVIIGFIVVAAIGFTNLQKGDA
ncbi:MAG TPA: YedE family putative selenium transporter [Bacillota bacterium]|nr:YedE family putative selenium transporter [Bacillota bacterium]